MPRHLVLGFFEWLAELSGRIEADAWREFSLRGKFKWG